MQRYAVCCSVLQCVAVCCSVLQHARVCCSGYCSVLQCVAVCCSVLQRVAVHVAVCCGLLQRTCMSAVPPQIRTRSRATRALRTSRTQSCKFDDVVYVNYTNSIIYKFDYSPMLVTTGPIYSPIHVYSVTNPNIKIR